MRTFATALESKYDSIYNISFKSLKLNFKNKI